MKEKVDRPAGRHIYSQHLGTGEPVFRNIASTLSIEPFTLEGREKINSHWILFAIVHNIGKGQAFTPHFP